MLNPVEGDLFPNPDGLDLRCPLTGMPACPRWSRSAVNSSGRVEGRPGEPEGVHVGEGAEFATRERPRDSATEQIPHAARLGSAEARWHGLEGQRAAVRDPAVDRRGPDRARGVDLRLIERRQRPRPVEDDEPLAAPVVVRHAAASEPGPRIGAGNAAKRQAYDALLGRPARIGRALEEEGVAPRLA